MLNIEAIKAADAAHKPFSFFKAHVLSETDLDQIRRISLPSRSRASTPWTPSNTGRASRRS